MNPGRSVPTLHAGADVVPLSRFALHDVESIRVLLRGGSIVDWVRLNFAEPEAIDAFLRVNGLDPERALDRARISMLKGRAIAYLEKHLSYRIPDSIRAADDARFLFDCASRTTGRRRDRFCACMTLKVMHIIHHVDAYDLLGRLSISDAELAVLLHAKVERSVRGLIERGFPIVEFAGNRKHQWSIYSKLLAKRSAQSAQVFDKLRFRITVQRLEDIPSLILAMTREVFPFNYLVPDQSFNSLVDLYALLNRAGNILTFKDVEANFDEDAPRADIQDGSVRNEFSGPDYRVVNFVVDLPVRVDTVFGERDTIFRELGPVVFGAVEFQIVDQDTAAKNESGDNRHTLYKRRQRQRVKQRLESGRRTSRRKEDSKA